MSEELNPFSGFTPLVHQVDISKETSMIATSGDIVKAHVITVQTKDGSEYVFSIENTDLIRLLLLINKVLILS